MTCSAHLIFARTVSGRTSLLQKRFFVQRLSIPNKNRGFFDENSIAKYPDIDLFQVAIFQQWFTTYFLHQYA